MTNALKIVNDAISENPDSSNFRINDGDCGLIIRKDGQIELFQQRIDTAALQKPHSSLSDCDKQSLLNGQTLMALSILANMPELQQTILSVAINEGAVTIPTANSNAA
ncbi:MULTISPECIES: hypothetical protein [unclassified Ensifer]|uniref:hypothetical protein n=1 Tax=unclassified Ensifer TaxID=2633371 RepID=UPI001146E0BA|nr:MULTISPECIES: hypothetical protein [unclassified Ensifer]